MATASTTIRPASDQSKPHRRRLAFALGATLLIGAGVAAVAVNVDHTDPAPVEHPASDTAVGAGLSSREYSARLRAERIAEARQPAVSSREYAARLRAERIAGMR